MEPKKLSTAEILARARAKDGGAKAGAASPPEPAPTPAAPAASPAPTATTPSAPPAPTPRSTKDILAAARAQAAGKAGGAAPSAPATATPAPPAAAKPAPTPGGTKDILAAARAQAAAKAGGGAAAAAAPTAKPAPKSAAATATAGGSAPSVQEMLKAVREGKPLAEAAPAPSRPAPAAPRIPTKPAPTAKGKSQAAPRRNFLFALLAAPFALAWILLSATGLISILGAARFMFPNVLVEPPSRFKVGPPGDYPGGTVSNKWKALYGIWIVNAEYQGKSLIYALSTVCTHLGCTPNWLDGEQKFKCPCHGSGFYITGVNFEGPAPRPLERFAIRRAEDGMLEVDKSQKFQQEMGQWDDPRSFVEVA